MLITSKIVVGNYFLEDCQLGAGLSRFGRLAGACSSPQAIGEPVPKHDGP
jgi:hypothetical protein